MADPPLSESDLAGTLERNIEAVARRRADDAAAVSRGERLAVAIGRRIGRMRFVYANLAFYAAWLAGSRGWLPGIPVFDHDLYLVGTVASVEAIFLSILILITQNHAATADDRRDALSLHVGLLAEHELTQLIKLNLAIARRLGIDTDDHPAIADTVHDIVPETVLDKIEDEEPKR